MSPYPARSRSFKSGGKKIEQHVIQALNTLARYGRVTALPDGKFAARRAERACESAH